MFESLVNKWAVLNGGPGSGIRGHQTDRFRDPRQATKQSAMPDGTPVWSVMLRHPKGGRVQILPSGNTKEEALKDAYRASKYHEGFKVQENTIKPHHSYSFFTPTPASMKSRLTSDQIKGIGSSAGASRKIRSHGGLRVKNSTIFNAGTPEGVQKAWVTRKSGGSWVNTHPTRNEGYGFAGTVDTRRMSGDQHWNKAMDAIIPHITKLGGTSEDARNFLDGKYGRHFADQVNGGKVGGLSHKEVSNQTSFGRPNEKGSMWHATMREAINNRSLFNGRPNFAAQVARFKANPVIVNTWSDSARAAALAARRGAGNAGSPVGVEFQDARDKAMAATGKANFSNKPEDHAVAEKSHRWAATFTPTGSFNHTEHQKQAEFHAGKIIHPPDLTPAGKNAPEIDAAKGVDGQGKTPQGAIFDKSKLPNAVPKPEAGSGSAPETVAAPSAAQATGLDGKVLPNSEKMVGPVMSVDTEKLMNASSAPSLIHIAPYGEFPHSSSGLMQIVDQTAAKNIVKNFNTQKDSNSKFDGLLVDFDHSSALGKGSVAAGWITNLQAKADGLWASVSWTPKGAKAIQNKEFKYCSPVWNRNECEELGNDRIRPTALSELAICNNPNIAGSEPLARVMV